MITGQVNSYSLTTLFRALSYRRRNGVLDLNFGNQELQIHFANGRVINVHNCKGGDAKAISLKLKQSGKLDETVFQSIAHVDVNTQQLCNYLLDNSFVKPDDFGFAKRAYEQELLLELKRLSEGSFSFAPKLVPVDPVVSLLLSPGQMLLDTIESETNETRFKELFPDGGELKIVAQSGTLQDSRLTPIEQLIKEKVSAKPGILVNDLFREILQPRHEIIKAFLNLLENEELLLDEEIDFKEQKLPAVAGEADSLLVEPLIENIIQGIQSQSEAIDAVEQLPQAIKAKHINGVVIPNSSESDVRQREDSTQSSREREQHGAKPESESIAGQKIIPDRQNSIQGSIVAKAKSFNVKQLVGMNQWLQSSDGIEKSSFYLTLAFLVFIALFWPSMFDSWFKALSDFTSVKF